MADSQAARERREEVAVEGYSWGTAYTGGREALIAAGLAKPEYFPGEPGCGKTTTDFRPKDGGRKFTVSRRSKYLYVVSILRTPEEVERFDAAKVREDAERDRFLLDHQAAAVRLLACPGTSPKQIAKACLDGTCLSAIMAFNMTDDPSRPVPLSRESEGRSKKARPRAHGALRERGL